MENTTQPVTLTRSRVVLVSMHSLSSSFLCFFPFVGFIPLLHKNFPLKAPAKKVSHGLAAYMAQGIQYINLSFIHSRCSLLSASLKRQIRTVGIGPSGGAGAPANGTVVRTAEEKTAEYAVFALVPVFCIMGLLGILICNILKKKGYRCSTDKEGGDEETATPQKEGKLE